VLTDGIAGLEGAGHTLCVVGSGPVGLALATDLVRRGQRVLLLESGGEAADTRIQSLAVADIVDPRRHDDMMIATARRLGGTSHLWGARCLPFDPIDFEQRDWVPATWPIGHEDIAPYWSAAVQATRSGAAVYHEALDGIDLQDNRFDVTALERWANKQQAQNVHAEVIAGDPKLDVRLHATLVGMEFAPNGRVTHIDVAHSLNGERVRLPMGTLVVAAGGLEGARLLLAARRDAPQRFGGEDGPLGRYYMGHVVGEIADITFASEAADRAFGYHVDAYDSYVRRRIVPSEALQREHRLLNTALWPLVPPVADAEHKSAILSLVYLAMRWPIIGRRIVAEAIRIQHAPLPPPPVVPHFVNLVAGAPAAAVFAADFLRRRHDKRNRLPGFFVRNRARRYGLAYHAEQLPRAESRVSLGSGVDRLGLPRLAIDYRVHPDDAASVVRTHDLMEDWLASTGFARLDYRVPRQERAQSVMDQSGHGAHQIGLTRMGANAREGVVDSNLRCFGAPNLHVVGTGVLPTSGQANPTLTAVALALRLSDHLATEAARPLRTAKALTT
jgi:hypothetical protein